MSEKILIVEDDRVLRETLAYNLAKQGYEALTATAGKKAVEIAHHEQPDLVLLDIMLPGMDGFEVCRILRQEMRIPILMLTARTDEVDKIVGFEVGADDYLTKPFSMRELLARIKAQLRRVRLLREEFAAESTPTSTQRLQFEDLVIDLDRHEVWLREQLLPLKPKSTNCLSFLPNVRAKPSPVNNCSKKYGGGIMAAAAARLMYISAGCGRRSNLTRRSPPAS